MTDFSNDPDYEECIVTFFDVLGFRNLLATRSGAEITRLLSTFRHISRSEEIDPPRRMAELRLTSEAHAEIVSDAIVRVRTTETQYPSGPLVWEIIDLLHIQIECLGNGILVRGAMAIGHMHLGADFSGPVFGPALVQAYEMEEREVVFPRIAIHEDVIERHRSDRNLWREDHSYDDEARHLSKLLRQDESGLHYIDYLRASLGEIDGEYEGWIGFLELHKQLVERGLSDSHNATIRRKYSWLRNYHNGVIDENLGRLPANSESEDRSIERAFQSLRITA